MSEYDRDLKAGRRIIEEYGIEAARQLKGSGSDFDRGFQDAIPKRRYGFYFAKITSDSNWCVLPFVTPGVFAIGADTIARDDDLHAICEICLGTQSKGIDNTMHAALVDFVAAYEGGIEDDERALSEAYHAAKRALK